MNKKLLKLLGDKCKDMGLTEKAIEDLVATGSEGLKDDSSDEDIEKAANQLVPYAKLMQSEGTRWAQKKNPKAEPTPNGGDDGKGDKIPAWFVDYKKKNDEAIKSLQDENSSLKTEKAKNERRAQISKKANELGIPEYLTKRLHIGDDADFEKELTDYKQELVTNNLMPADAGGEKGNAEKISKEDAKTWASSLPSN